MTPPTLTLVVPCYNEQSVIAELVRRLDLVLDGMIAAGRIQARSHVLFVDDGSRDQTWAAVAALNTVSTRYCGVKLSRNRGHQAALLAGLSAATGDAVVSLDADLQDDPDAIVRMVDAYLDGADVVYGVRASREADTPFKRGSARLYYRLLSGLGVEIVHDHADYRLLSRRAIEALKGFHERNLFLRALIPQLGFSTAVVTYERSSRFAGESKYPLRRMLALAFDGITSFSVRPLRLILFLGLIVSAMSFALGIWAIVATLIFEVTVPGWASTVVPVYFVCGLQMLCLGVIGEYVGRIYIETKQRPRFFVEQELGQHAPGRPLSATPDEVAAAP